MENVQITLNEQNEIQVHKNRKLNLKGIKFDIKTSRLQCSKFMYQPMFSLRAFFGRSITKNCTGNTKVSEFTLGRGVEVGGNGETTEVFLNRTNMLSYSICETTKGFTYVQYFATLTNNDVDNVRRCASKVVCDLIRVSWPCDGEVGVFSNIFTCGAQRAAT